MKYTSSKSAAKKALDYMSKRRSGTIKPVALPWQKVNNFLGGGIEWGEICSIGGMSGSGKSSFLTMVEGYFALDPDTYILSFNLEMRAHRIVMRKLSRELKIPIKELYNKKTYIPTNRLKYAYKDIISQNVFYDEMSTSVERIVQSIHLFAAKHKLKERGKNFIVTLDYASLIDYKKDEKIELINLMKALNLMKKKYDKIIFIVLTQLNRNIEHANRRSSTNRSLHYPIKSDIYGSDAIFGTSDIVMVLHNPYQMGIASYGPKKVPSKGKIFLHMIKGRDVGTSVFVFNNDLKHNNLEE